MPFSRIFTGAVIGIEAVLIEVEVNIDFRGFPSFSIVGLPSKEVEESKERVRSAIKNSGIKFPDAKITVNLAPADLQKRGSLYDLPIAIGILSASGHINKEIDEYFIFGELSLNGKINPVRGTISLLDLADKNYRYAIIPSLNISEAAFAKNIKIYPCTYLKQIISHLNGMENIEFNYPASVVLSTTNPKFLIIKNVKGQQSAKRAICLAAAGGHNIALSGPPGTGKTMLCKALSDLLPKMSDTEIFEVSRIYSAEATLINNLVTERPFRSPHHGISKAGLIGGGNPIRPGEISLAHNGVLFLDEFPEFTSELIESLRQPLESKEITISRSSGHVNYPSNFILAVAYNLCPCGLTLFMSLIG